jgi:hypothetical protein
MEGESSHNSQKTRSGCTLSLPMMRRPLLLALLSVLGCVREAPPPVTGPRGGAVAHVTPTGDPLADTLARIDRDLASRGFSGQGTSVRGQLAAGAITAYPLQAQTGICYVAFVLPSAPGTEIDLYLYDLDGTEVGSHLGPGTPFVAYCPIRAGRHDVDVFAESGGGAYLFALYAGSAPPGDLAQVFAARADTAAAAGPAPVDPSIAPRVASRDRRLASGGLTRAGAPSSALLQREEARRVTATLTHGTCYAFAAFSGARGQDVDLFLYAPGGQRLERDDGHEADAFVRHCPLVSGSYQLEVKLSDGQGPVWLVSWAQGPALPTAVASFEEGGPAPGAAGDASSPPDAARRRLEHDMHARGYEAMADAVVDTVGNGNVAQHEIALEAGKCYALTAAADASVTDVDVAVFDRQTEIGRDTTNATWAVARVCPPRALRARVEVSAAAGAGQAQMRSYVWPHSTQGPFDLQGAIFVRLAEATNLLGRHGYEPSASPVLADIHEGQPVRADVDLAAGTCYALVATGNADVRDLGLSLLAGSAVLANAEPHEPVAIVRACPEVQAHHHLELRSLRGSGQVLHQVFQMPSTPSDAPPPAP